MTGVRRTGKSTCLLYAFVLVVPIVVSGCGHLAEDVEVRSSFRDANNFFNKGSYQDSLKEYEQILARYPGKGDEALFEMGIVYLYPKKEGRDLVKSRESFERLVRDYPESSFRQSSELMLLYIKELSANNLMSASRLNEMDLIKQELGTKDTEILSLQRQLKSLDHTLVTLAAKHKLVDRVLVEKRQRRLTLLSKGDVVKSYKIALGGNPNGPKEREGDNKTPEGIYLIDSRNYNSYYHLSLHISYPNASDKKVAKKLGASPGGGISIHGLHGGWLRGGDEHVVVDWTDGCIAVTNEEIEELDQLVPNGMTVEIRP
ncbi:MAG TPA: L,D-transpeptidase family protein [Geomonas sp.]|nr:L,D-transpeptidase family protein [Geomonas sp.]